MIESTRTRLMLDRREFMVLSGCAILTAALPAIANPWVRFRLETPGTDYYLQGTISLKDFKRAVLPNHSGDTLVYLRFI